MNRLFIISVVLICSIYGSLFSQEADNYLIKAALLCNAKQYNEALEAATQSKATTNASYNNILANIEFGLKNFDKAIEYYTQAEKEKPGTYQLELAKCNALMGNKPGAIQHVKIYLKTSGKLPISKIVNDESFKDLKGLPEWDKIWHTIDYSDQEIIVNRVKTALESGDQGNIQNTLQDALLQFPRNPELLSQQAKYYSSIKQYDAAYNSINQAININSSNDKFYYQKALILNNTSPKEALTAINNAIGKNPFSSEYYLLRIDVNKSLGNSDKVKEDMDLLEFSLPNLPEVKLTKVKLNCDKGDYLNALAGLNELIKNDQSKAEYYILRGKIGIKSERYQNADYDFGMALDLDPSDAEANMGKGLAKFKQQDRKAACFYWQNAAQKGNREAQEYLLKYCNK